MKIKHLEFIQAVITRMNSNSFMIKGWAITIISALFALSAQSGDQRMLYIAYVVVPLFWLMDALHLAQERKYRGLYNHVKDLEEAKIDFGMDAKNYGKEEGKLLNALFSISLLIFYGLSMIAPFLVTLILY